MTNIPSWTRVRIGSGSAATITVNDMKAATTFGEAVPEPTSALLVGLLAPVLLLRPRRA